MLTNTLRVHLTECTYFTGIHPFATHSPKNPIFATQKEPPMVILFNKPYGVLSQFTPEAGHRALNEFGFPPGVYAAGRLDHDSEGALLLTDDGRLVKRLLDPKNAHPRTYLAQVDGEITDEALQKLRKGVVIKGYRTRPCKAEKALPPAHPHRGQEPPSPPHDRRRRLPHAAAHPRPNRRPQLGRTPAGRVEDCQIETNGKSGTTMKKRIFAAQNLPL